MGDVNTVMLGKSCVSINEFANMSVLTTLLICQY